MNKKIEEQRFEFVLRINSHIICQRYFSIKDYNAEVINSIELKELMDRIIGLQPQTSDGKYVTMGIITNNLKKKSMEYLWKAYKPYNLKDDPYKNLFEKEDTFNFEIIVDKEIVAQSTFSGNLFPPQIRYDVNIKELIPAIIAEIKETFSQKNYTSEYADIEL